MTMFRTFQHVLPNAKAWRLTIDKPLRKFVAGVSAPADSIRTYFGGVWGDLIPESTQSLDEWEGQFGLPDTGLPESARRQRLRAAWAAQGGQSPRYIQDTLQANGFGVYVHEWFTGAAFPLSASYCGDLSAESGEAGVECVGVQHTTRNPNDVLAPDNIVPVAGKGYPLVNLITGVTPNLLALCGEAGAESGESLITCYNHVGYTFTPKKYETTSDPNTWPYYLYLGGETFGTLAQVPASRRFEFETLCLKICPTQQWLGVMVEYS